MTWEVEVGGRTYEVEVRQGPEGLVVRLDGGDPIPLEAVETGPHQLLLIVGGRSYDVGLAPRDDGFAVDLLGEHHPCRVQDPRRRALRLAGGSGDGKVVTTMPGRVVRVLVEPGEEIEKGAPVLVVEAMKMENELRAPVAGTVEEVLVAPGDTVEAGAILVRIA